MATKPLNENIEFAPVGQPIPRPGPFLARVIGHLDATYMGRLEVELLRVVGNDGLEGQLCQVSYLNPFYGTTDVRHVGKQDDYANTQKSYGMWFVPPDPGTIVMVIFIDGRPDKGYWMGCVMDESMNFMLPGIAATENTVDGKGRVPVAEYNKVATETCPADPTKAKKPKHPLEEVLSNQGLLLDDIRGITTSSARRELPSAVFGISTPGPVDKTSKGKFAAIGPVKSLVPNAPVSRLGGTTFVMDDGDDKFLRKKTPGEGPPEYVSPEQGETGGDLKIPHNELVRIRTRTGHQILLHNSEDLIYIGNARGTAWVELTSNGKIDIYSKDSISVHSENDINFTADRDINFDAGRNINLNSKYDLSTTLGGSLNLKVAQGGKITVGTALDVNVDKMHVTASTEFTVGATSTVTFAAGVINMNAGSAPSAAKAVATPKPARVPMVEPWAGHENLDPQSCTPAKTEAAVSPAAPAGGAFYKKYTTKTDTFNKVQGASK